jgi:amidohydrolase
MKRKFHLAVFVALLCLPALCQQPATRHQQPTARHKKLLAAKSQPAEATGAREQQIAALADAMKPELVATRRDFHEHPELSNREQRTSEVVAARLRALGLEVKTGVARYGVVALLKGGRPGPVVAVRADMDALPINETMDVPYKSQDPGVKHACGHDAHMTIELGVAEILTKMRDQLPGTVKFIFQPAEEGPPAGEEGGAELMVKEGALENPRPQAIFGLHDNPVLQTGEVGWVSGPVAASADRFVVTIHGKGAHGAQPENAIDPIVIAAQAITALQDIRSRRIATLAPLVLTVGSIHGGNRFNIIPDEVQFEGTVRCLDKKTEQTVEAMMRQTLQGVTAAYGATYSMEYDKFTPVTYNDPALAAATRPTLERLVGKDHVIDVGPQMFSEDFAYFDQVVPGFYYLLGVGNKAKGITAGLHTAAFDLDEDALPIGVKVMTNVLWDYLEQQRGETETR